MKKSIYLLLMVATGCYHTTNAGMFDGLTQLIAKNIESWRKPKLEAYQTPPAMVPLSNYHCIGKKYTSEVPVTKLEQEIKNGIRYFEFDISSIEKVSQNIYTLFRVKKKQIEVVGQNKRELISVIAELAAILQKSAYAQEVVIVKLNNSNYDLIDSNLKKLLFTPGDLTQNVNPTLQTLRSKNKRLAVLVGKTSYEVYPEVFLLKNTRYKQLFNPENNYALIENLQTNIPATNRLNAAQVGSPSFPKVSRSFFSPHFNMYHYVGMDYTEKALDEIQRELAYGVRGFILPLKKVGDVILVGNTQTTVKDALKIISVFAKEYNEIVVVHLKNIDAVGQQAINTITNDQIIQKVLFKPADRLIQAEESAAKDKILAFEAKTKEKKIWPRLIWNYEKEKLVQITWDAPDNTGNVWAYNSYYNDDITQHSLTNVESSIIAPTDFEKTAPFKAEKPALFYSGVLKTEQTAAAAIPATAAFAVGLWIATQKLTDIAMWSAPSYREAIPLYVEGGRPIPTEKQYMGSLALVKIFVAFAALLPFSLIKDSIYAAKNTFTIVREELIPINSMINGFFINKPISESIAAKFDNKKTIFDKVNYLNRYNYILIDKHAISWTLTLSHLIRKALAAKV